MLPHQNSNWSLGKIFMIVSIKFYSQVIRHTTNVWCLLNYTKKLTLEDYPIVFTTRSEVKHLAFI